ncbi:nuclease-related domain-containing protein [Ureibacillus chungkukjangi]|uniref:Nuclease-like protein n=1 Tax=Ureibacillus chungkukjangi TaxID=1202712 RepID=A0A318TP18_9BACL|nr:nuclease-related domain-containing protein [Ureibacillus chungkukjangi]PYF04758.1 nuclease-like protein [Ureibacillus chungkukjangi]
MRNLLFKHRTESIELIILSFLNRRMELSKTDQQLYYNLRKGYEGELMFDALTKNLTSDCLVLNDLVFKTNNQNFQIDSLIIMKNQIYLLEIKNFSGDHFYKSNDRLHNTRKEITNPLIQLCRSETLLRQMLIKLNTNIPIQAYVIFINPEFTMYQAPMEKPFIFPGQLNRFFKKLNTDTAKLTPQQTELAEALLSLHLQENPYQQLPTYNYQEVKKGIACSNCQSFDMQIIGRKCRCMTCGVIELFDTAVARTVNEYKILFPNEKVTTNKMIEWCNITPSKQRIQRSLKKHFQHSGKHQWSYYQ